MKTTKILTIGILLSGVMLVKAQNTFPATGNVGIYTTTPQEKLDVNGNIKFNSVLYTTGRAHINGGEKLYLLNKEGVVIGKEWGGNGNLQVQGNTSILSQLSVGGDINFSGTLTSNNGRMRLTGSERLYLLNKEGVIIGKEWGGNGDLQVQGNTSLLSQLSVGGDINFGNTLTSNGRMHLNGSEKLYLLNKEGVIIGKEWGGNGNLQVQGNTSILSQLNVTGNIYGNDFISAGSNSWIMHTPDDGRTNLYFAPNTNGTWDWSTQIYFKNNGTAIFKNVGIGTNNPDQKLTVKGKIHSEEVIVDLQVPADYVFEKYYTGKSALKADYKMPTLLEIEQYTKKNNHLPNIPSAKEIQEKGMQLGEMTNLLLQKIEELTLYTIEQQKRIELLEAKLSDKK